MSSYLEREMYNLQITHPKLLGEEDESFGFNVGIYFNTDLPEAESEHNQFEKLSTFNDYIEHKNGNTYAYTVACHTSTDKAAEHMKVLLSKIKNYDTKTKILPEHQYYNPYEPMNSI